MVYVDDKKFACEACIKGHRSSGCQHTDRPLFEVKKKGRPVSQCDKCRELRKTKRMHGKCTCASNSAAAGSSAEVKGVDPTDGFATKPKSRRFKPIAPALPNGLKDVLPSDADVSVSLNLCRCGGKDASICTCGHQRAAPSRPTNTNVADGLATLAQAALLCCGGDLPSTSDKTTEVPAAPAETEFASRKHTRSCCSSAANSRPPSPKPKRSKQSPHSSSHSNITGSGVAQTPMSAHQHIHTSSAPPTFPPITAFGPVVLFEDTGCCCGTQCSCPGCLVHRGAEHAAKDYRDCTDGECRTCVDNEGGYALPDHILAYSQGGSASLSDSMVVPPPLSSSSSFVSTSTPTLRSGRDESQTVSCIDVFFATAASLPAPPPGRTGALDPTNVLVYPRGVLAGDAGTRSLFGLVEVPKLQCNCPGGCGCPEGQCGCGDGCTGCGPVHEEVEEEEPVPEQRSAVTVPVKSCCSG